MKMFQHKKKDIAARRPWSLVLDHSFALYLMWRCDVTLTDFNKVGNLCLFLFVFSNILLKLNITLHNVLRQVWKGKWSNPGWGSPLGRAQPALPWEPCSSLARGDTWRARCRQAREASKPGTDGSLWAQQRPAAPKRRSSRAYSQGREKGLDGGGFAI